MSRLDASDTELGLTSTGIRLRLLDNGWFPIPVIGKKPNAGSGWQRYCHAPPTNFEVQRWEHTAAASTGIALGTCAVAIDIDIKSSPELAEAARNLAFKHLGWTPFVRVGQAPKSLLIYRPGPGGIALRRLKDATGGGDGLDILSTGSQFVAYGTHPDTNRPYTWVGESRPLDEGPEAAPEITQDQVDAYIEAFSREIMQLTAVGGGGGARKGAGDVTRNACGLVTDGCFHWFSLEVTKQAACGLCAEGDRPTAKAIFERAWAAWTDPQTGAVWRDEEARQYVWKEAQYTAKRVASGRLNVEPQESYEAPAEPTYPSRGVDVEQARRATDAAIGAFLEGIPTAEVQKQPIVESHLFGATPSDDEPQRPPYVRGLRVATGVGKTSIAIKRIIELIAHWRAEEEAERGGALYDPAQHRRRRVLFLVPRHALGEEVRAKFLPPVSARIFRGRGARRPNAASAEDRMCLDYATVQKAQAAGESVAETCCHGPKPRLKGSARRKRGEIEYATCRFFDSCPYQAQKQGDVDVWIAAHNALFDNQVIFKDIGLIVVDEGFALGGTWETDGMSLATLVDGAFPASKLDTPDYRLAETRVKLARAFQSVESKGFEGRVPRSALVTAGLTEELLEIVLKLQWAEKRETGAFPGMGDDAREAALRIAAGNKVARHLAQIIEAALNLIRRDNPGAVSGRLRMAEAQVEKGGGKAQVVKVSGVKSVLKRWNEVPTLLLDATMPELPLLRRFFPDIELLDDIDVKMPAATRITQVVGAPVSDGKLMRSEGERNLEAVRYALIAEHLKFGGALTLVVCPLKVREWLERRGMPTEIKMAHFNGIAGLDEFKDVRLLITIGRLLPMPREIEALAWKLSGLEGFAIPKQETAGPNLAHRVWYPKPKLAYGMRDGSGRAARAERHPNDLVESIRYQICEAEVLQAIGRGRGVNRTLANPLDVQIWADMVLPLELDEVIPWEAVQAGPEVAMARDGMFLESPTDMATVWPDTWDTTDTARFWQRQKLSKIGGQAEISLYIQLVFRRFSASSLTRIDYRRAVSKVKRAVAWVDLAVVPDPRSWLEDRLGPLAHFEITPLSVAAVVKEPPAIEIVAPASVEAAAPEINESQCDWWDQPDPMRVGDGQAPLVPATAPERIRAEVNRQMAALAQAGCTGPGALQAALEMVEADIANAPELAKHQVSDHCCIVCSEPERRGRPFIPVLCGVPDQIHWLHVACHAEHAHRITLKVEQVMAAAGYGSEKRAALSA